MVKQTVTHLLNEVSVGFRKGLEAYLSPLGLHSGQVFVLYALWDRDGLAQADLARELGLAAPTVSRMVRSLEKSGFVTSKRSESDARIIEIFLEEKAKRLEGDVRDAVESFEAEFTSELTETEMLMLEQLLNKLGEQV